MEEKLTKEEMQNLINETKSATAELKAATAEREALLVKEAESRQLNALSGKSEAGVILPPVDPEKEAKDKLNLWLKSTGMQI